MQNSDYDQLEEDAIEQIYTLLSKAKGGVLRDLQPPTSVVRCMASGAAAALIAFERGYQMTRESENA